MKKYMCSICGYIHSEAEKGKWEDLPGDFVCPLCSAVKSLFNPIEEGEAQKVSEKSNKPLDTMHVEKLKELTAAEISVICSSLARGCEKQRLNSEMEAFKKIAAYYKSKAVVEKGKTLDDAAKMLDSDISMWYPAANNAAKAGSPQGGEDRGALRSLVWSEKVSLMAKSLLERFAKEGEAMLESTRIYVCEICGFIYLGGKLPDICPVCKAPNFKLIEVER
jgi:rubrerythrin